MFPKIVVPPNHPYLIGFSILNHPFWGTPIFGNTHICFGAKFKHSPHQPCQRPPSIVVERLEASELVASWRLVEDLIADHRVVVGVKITPEKPIYVRPFLGVMTDSMYNWYRDPPEVRYVSIDEIDPCKLTNNWLESSNPLKMYLPWKMDIFQPAMLVSGKVCFW